LLTSEMPPGEPGIHSHANRTAISDFNSIAA